MMQTGDRKARSSSAELCIIVFCIMREKFGLRSRHDRKQEALEYRAMPVGFIIF